MPVGWGLTVVRGKLSLRAMVDVCPHSPANRFRARRMAAFLDLAYRIAETNGSPCRVVDIGGTSEFWFTWREHVDWSRVRVTCLNLYPDHNRHDFEHVRAAYGDATNLSGIADSSFDLVHSNSVIEHVGRANFAAFAGEVRRIAARYFVQTPNYWFPIEPHARTTLLHWVPDRVAARLVMRRARGFWPRAESMQDAIRILRSAELLTRRELAELFPDAEIVPERFAGMIKSWMAVRR